jgi:P27 family predicted phage terminase small subunit
MALGRRGPPPQPTHLRLLRGNPSRRPVNRNEPQPARAAEIPAPPDFLTGYAREEWARIAPELFRLGLLTIVDEPALAAYCTSFATFRTAVETLAKMGEADPVSRALMIKTVKGGATQNPLFLTARQAANDMLRVAAEFGMTPAARSRLNSPFGPPPGPSKFDGLMGPRA